MKASEIIDCTCTVVSISSISRFACANVRSVRVVTRSIDVTFVGVCFAFVNICQKKGKKRKEWKMGFGFYSKVIHVHVCEKSGILVCNFLVSCDSRVGPVSQTTIFQIFSLWYSNGLSKAYTQNTLYKQKEKERTKKLIHDRISSQFSIHLCNFVQFQYIQAANRIHVIHWCWCSLHSRDKKGFLYTRQRLWNHRWKKLGFQNYAKIAEHKPLPCLRVQAVAIFNLLLEYENARLSYLVKKSCLSKNLSLKKSL